MPAPPRSMLFVSGERPERYAKAMAAGADLVCIDLEDAVHPDAKVASRAAALAFASGTEPRAAQLAIRCNALRTREGLADMAALAASNARLDWLLLPKVEHADDLGLVHAWVAPRFDALSVLIETPLGIERAPTLAAAVRDGAPKLGALMLGGADLSVELGCAFAWDGLLPARGRLVNAARSAGLEAWDVPHLDLADLPALADETRAALRLGYTCKTAIHPSQIATIHAAFAPAAADVEWATALLAAWSEMQANGGVRGAFLFRGKMVDPPVLAKAQRIARLATG